MSSQPNNNNVGDFSNQENNNNNIQQDHHQSQPPLRRIGTRSGRKKGCCPSPPLRCILAFYIIISAILISAIVLLVNYTMYTGAILDIANTYQHLVTTTTQQDLTDFFNTPLDVATSVRVSLRQADNGFMVPSENPEMNATHPFTIPFRAAVSTVAGPFVSFALFFDDGSQFLGGGQILRTADTRGGGAQFTPDQLAFVSTMAASTRSGGTSSPGVVTEEAVFLSNLSGIDINNNNLGVATLGLTNASNKVPQFYSGLKAFSQATNNYDPSWGQAIALKLTENQDTYLAIPVTMPVFNVSGDWVGIMGVAVNTEPFSGFLSQVISESGTSEMVAMIVDIGLTILATNLVGREKSYQLAEEVPYNGDPSTLAFGCLATSESISSTVSTGQAYCVKTPFTFGFEPAARFFGKFSYTTVYDSTFMAWESRSGIFNVTNDDHPIYLDPQTIETADYDEYVASFGQFIVPGLTAGVAYLTPVNDYLSTLSTGQSVMIGVAVASILVAAIITFISVKFWLGPLEDVAELMVSTAHLRFDAQSKYISNKAFLDLGKHDEQNKARKLRRSKSFSKVSSHGGGHADECDDENERKKCREHDEDHDYDDDNEDLDPKEIEKRRKEEVENSLSPVVEIRALQKAQMNMSNALNSFTKYLSREVVKELQISGVRIGMSRKKATILQSDIAGFTTLSEQVSPAVLSDLLTLYFEKINGIVIAHGAVIFMFVGDAILAGWGAVFKTFGNDQLKAALCALEMQRTASINPLTSAWDTLANKRLWQRIGINSGEIFAGVTGSSSRLAFSVSGPNVDFAQYLESAGKQFGTLTTVSSSVAAEIKDVFSLRLLMPVMQGGNLHQSPTSKPVNAGGGGDNGTSTSATSSSRQQSVLTNDIIVENVGSPSGSRQVSAVSEQFEEAGAAPAPSAIVTGTSPSFGQQQQQLVNNNNTGQGMESPSSLLVYHQSPSSAVHSSSSIFNSGGSIMNAYELVGLLPGVNIEEKIRPERTFFGANSDTNTLRASPEFFSGGPQQHRSSHRRRSSIPSGFSGIDTPQPLSPTKYQRGDSRKDQDFEGAMVYRDVVRNGSIDGDTTTGGGSGGAAAQQQRGVITIDSATDQEMVIASPNSNHSSSSATFPSMSGNNKNTNNNNNTTSVGNNDQRSVATSKATDASNEEFLRRVADNTQFYLPADNLFKRSYSHKKCTFVAADLEMRFSREWSQLVRHFENGDPALALSALQDIKKKTEYHIFFAKVGKDFASEEEFEEAYRNAIGDQQKCCATFIRAGKSEELLVKTCKRILKEKQQVSGGFEEVIYAIRM